MDPVASFRDENISQKHRAMGVTDELLNEVTTALLESIDPRHSEYGNSWFIPATNARFKALLESGETPSGNKVVCALKYIMPELLKALAKAGRSYAWFGLPDDGKSLGYLIRNGEYEARSTHCSHREGLVYGVAKLHDRPWRLPDITGVKQAAGVRVLVRDTTTGDLHILMSRKPNGSGRGKLWGSPCGYMNAGERPPEAVMREFKEEVSYNEAAISGEAPLQSQGHTQQTQYWPHIDDINYRMLMVWDCADPSKLELKPQTAIEEGESITELQDVRLFNVNDLPEDCNQATLKAVAEAVKSIETGVAVEHSVTSFGWGAHTVVDKYAPVLLKN